jgi:hypothetical protein
MGKVLCLVDTATTNTCIPYLYQTFLLYNSFSVTHYTLLIHVIANIITLDLKNTLE